MKPSTIAIVGVGVLLLLTSSRARAAVAPVTVVIPPHPAETRAIEKSVTDAHVSTAKKTALRGKKARVQAFLPVFSLGPMPVDTAPAVKALSHRPSDMPAAARTAQSLADSVRNSGGRYDSVRVAAWQAAAGIPVTGVYDSATVKRLRAHGARNVVGPMGKRNG